MAHYNHTISDREKWREHWEKNPVNVNDGKKEKYYCLDMFPYRKCPAADCTWDTGNYVISDDTKGRYQLLREPVRHPSMGWDAFGLPAENYAIKMGVRRAISTAGDVKKNIKSRSSRSRPSTTAGYGGQHHGSELLQVDSVDFCEDV